MDTQSAALLERVVALEVNQRAYHKDLEELKGDFKELTHAVNRLTSVLEQGKGVKVFVYTVLALMPVLSGITGFLVWLKN